MNRTDFISKFQASGEVTAEALTQLAAVTGVQDPAAIAAAAMDAALVEFSRASRRVLSVSDSWAEAAVTLANWYEGSTLLTVECPTGTHPPTYLAPSQIELDQDAGTVYLISIASGTAYKIRYTVMHEIPAMPEGDDDPEDVTIPASQHTAFFRLTAAVIFERLAGRYAETTGSGFAADSVQYQTKTGEYLKLAKEARRQYRLALGLPETPSPDIAGFSVEYETPPWRTMPEVPWS